MTRNSSSPVPLPFGIRIPNGNEMYVTTTNVGAYTAVLDGDMTVIHAPNETIYNLWRKELAKAKSPFTLLE